MKTEIKLITPAIAEKMIANNPMNRALRLGDIELYSRLMNAGLWKEYTGEAIQIAVDGSLLNGQHRLLALIKAGVKLNFLIITDLEKDVFTVLDSGMKRNASDVFHIAGVLNSSNTSTAIRRYFNLLSGNTMQRNHKNISSSELLALYNKRADFWTKSIQMSSNWYGKSQRLLKLTEICALFAFLRDISEDDSFNFMDQLCSGNNLEVTSPIKLLRDKLLFSQMNKKFNLIPSVRTAYIFKAWNLYRSGESVKFIKFNSELDNYPVPI